MMQMLLPLRSIWSRCLLVNPSVVSSYSVTSSSTILTKSSKPRRSPTNSLSPLITIQIRDPIHRSMSSRGRMRGAATPGAWLPTSTVDIPSDPASAMIVPSLGRNYDDPSPREYIIPFKPPSPSLAPQPRCPGVGYFRIWVWTRRLKQMIRSCIFISARGGVILYRKDFSWSAPQPRLVGGLITALLEFSAQHGRAPFCHLAMEHRRSPPALDLLTVVGQRLITFFHKFRCP
mmetsp:Transcript_16499/g.33697  ORF Transcript_16499/g.33697 Transcript_16499/m.33697 type:complete len:232 (+) Transcript_16499:2288-2983(+)